MSDNEKVIRIPFTIYRDNPEHEKVYAILEKQKNRNAFLRSAVLAYYAQGKPNGQTISAQEIRRIVKESNEELAECLLRKLALADKEGCNPSRESSPLEDVPEQFGEEKKPVDFAQLKNLF